MFQFPIGIFFGATGGAELWTPAELSDLDAWYDASDETTITDTGGLVDGLEDKSPNGYDLIGSSTARPVTGSTTINSLNVIDFDGVNDVLKTAREDPDNFDNFAVFIVVKKATFGTDSSYSLFTLRSEYANRVSMHLESYAEDRQSFICNNASNKTVLEVFNDTDSITRIYEGIKRNLTMKNWQDGVEGSNSETSDTGNTDAWWYWIGDKFEGSFCEAVVVQSSSTSISTEDQEKTEGYLAHKWGIDGNLDSGHTYKSEAPTI